MAGLWPWERPVRCGDGLIRSVALSASPGRAPEPGVGDVRARLVIGSHRDAPYHRWSPGAASRRCCLGPGRTAGARSNTPRTTRSRFAGPADRMQDLGLRALVSAFRVWSGVPVDVHRCGARYCCERVAGMNLAAGNRHGHGSDVRSHAAAAVDGRRCWPRCCWVWTLAVTPQVVVCCGGGLRDHQSAPGPGPDGVRGA